MLRTGLLFFSLTIAASAASFADVLDDLVCPIANSEVTTNLLCFLLHTTLYILFIIPLSNLAING